MLIDLSVSYSFVTYSSSLTSKSLSQWPFKSLYFKLSLQKCYYMMRLRQPSYTSSGERAHFVPSKRTVLFKEQLAIVCHLTPSLSRIVDYRSTLSYLGFRSPTSSENRKVWPSHSWCRCEASLVTHRSFQLRASTVRWSCCLFCCFVTLGYTKHCG